MTSKESASERRAREAKEAAEAQKKFEAKKPMRLLHAIAEAYNLGITATTMLKYDNVLYYFFDIENNVYCDPYAELSEWTLNNIEADIKRVRENRDHKMRLERVRIDLLARLTNEEKEALGI